MTVDHIITDGKVWSYIDSTFVSSLALNASVHPSEVHVRNEDSVLSAIATRLADDTRDLHNMILNDI